MTPMMTFRMRYRTAWRHYETTALPTCWINASPLRTAYLIIEQLFLLILQPLTLRHCPVCTCPAAMATNYRSILEHGACLACAALAQNKSQAELFNNFHSYGTFEDYNHMTDPITCCNGRKPQPQLPFHHTNTLN